LVHVCEGNTSTDGYLSTDDTVTTVESSGEHVHGTTLAVCNTLSPAKQFTDDRSDAATTHKSETVASVGCDETVFLGDAVLNTNSNSFLTSGQMAETTNLLLLVKSVGGHLHSSSRFH